MQVDHNILAACIDCIQITTKKTYKSRTKLGRCYLRLVSVYVRAKEFQLHALPAFASFAGRNQVNHQ